MMLTSLLATLALSPSVQAWHKHKAHHHKEHSHHKHVPAPICKPEYKVECLYQVGGGPTTATGGQTVPQLTGAKLAECIPTFKKYFAEGGQYYNDLDYYKEQVLAYYKGADNVTQMLYFDIDETSLSNVPEFKKFDYNTSAAFAATQGTGATPPFAPPIKQTLEIYTTAYKLGYSLAFITGRGESQRTFTEANLANAGYGKQCPGGNGSSIAEHPDGTPCWVELNLRGPDDTTLASVYKPTRRAELEKRGYQIVGSFGDQYSDLEGLYSSVVNWKLPNPLYYIL